MIKLLRNRKHANILNRNKDQLLNIINYEKGNSYETMASVEVLSEPTDLKIERDGGVVSYLQTSVDNLRLMKYKNRNFENKVIDLFDINLEGVDFTIAAIQVIEIPGNSGKESYALRNQKISVRTESVVAYHVQGRDITISLVHIKEALPQWRTAVLEIALPIDRPFSLHPYSDDTAEGESLAHIQFDREGKRIAFLPISEKCIYLNGIGNNKGLLDRLNFPRVFLFTSHVGDKPMNLDQADEWPRVLSQMKSNQMYNNHIGTEKHPLSKFEELKVSSDVILPPQNFKLEIQTYYDSFAILVKSDKFPGLLELKTYTKVDDEDYFLNVTSHFFKKGMFFSSTNYSDLSSTYMTNRAFGVFKSSPLINSDEILDELLNDGVINEFEKEKSKENSVNIIYSVLGGLLKDVLNSPVEFYLDHYNLPTQGRVEDQYKIGTHLGESIGISLRRNNALFNIPDPRTKETTFPENMLLSMDQLDYMSKKTTFRTSSLYSLIMFWYRKVESYHDYEDFEFVVDQVDTLIMMVEAVKPDEVYGNESHRIYHLIRSILAGADDAGELVLRIADYLPQLSESGYDYYPKN